MASITGTPSGGGTWYFLPQLTDATGLSTQGFSLNGASGYPLSITVQATIPSGNPIPFISQPLVPDAAAPGGAGLALTVNGAGFVSGAAVNFNGTALTTTFVSSTQLTANVPASEIASAGTASVTVVNPAPGGGASNVVYFPVATPEAAVTLSNVSGSPMQTDPPSAFPVSIAVADFNGDGKPDLAVTNQNPGTITIFLGTGQADGTFTEPASSPITLQTVPFSAGLPQNPGLTLVGDFNNSGNPGLAVLQASADNVAILFGNGNGSFTQSTATAYTQGCPSGLAAADFIGNGNVDLVVTNSCGAALAFLLGYGDGAFTYEPASPPAMDGGCLVGGDFNGDGKLDLACALYDEGSATTFVYVLLGNGDGTFTQVPGSPITITGVIGGALIAGDFNGDGKLDLGMTTGPSLNEGSTPGAVYIFLGNGDGTFTPASGSPIAVGIEPGPIAMADFNGDGKVDLAIGNVMSNNVTLLLGNGDGTFTEATGSPFAVGRGPGALAVADFIGSGRLGLAVVNYYDRTISILVQQP
ncbi:MAG TPA: VCBS repeat-containing protein [Candidatus Cybelea sp.]|nr:VCBS repeat-containing protein [Candidatus Cybelea sp.]